ncbi:MAG: ferrous iron transporter B, partial [Richelia sp. SM2_1_7]|nr:ferrous iron transporter B [Richelia sp. SM2_1_7]
MTHCNPSSISADNLSSQLKQIAVLGMPNTGKSTFFNRFTGSQASIGNWPGMTVDLMMAEVSLNQQPTQVVDLPGIYDLRGFSEDEAVVQKFLETTPVHLIIIILNSTQIERQISLALQIKSLKLPAVLLLNMADEAASFGVTINYEKLSEHLQIPVIPISAKYGEGCEKAFQIIGENLEQQSQPITVGKVTEKLPSEAEINSEMESILTAAVAINSEISENWTTRLDKIFLHPIFGLPIFFITMFFIFQFIYALGIPLQDLLTDGLAWFKDNALEPLLNYLPWLGTFWHNFIVEGIYEGIGTVAAFI